MIINVNRYRVASILGLIPFLGAETVLAAETRTVGDVADKLIVGTDFLTHFMHFACIIVGIILLIMALSFYKAHRDNPKFIPIERPIIYFFLGLILIALPYLGQIFGVVTGSPQDLHKREFMAPNPNQPMDDVDAPIEWGEDYDH